MTAEQLITGHVVPLKPTDTGAMALSMMEEMRLSHLPVVDGTEFLGILSDKIILESDDPEMAAGMFKLDASLLVARTGEHIYDVLKLFSAHKLSMVPVVSENRVYLGAIVLPTVMQSLAGMIGVDEPGGIIILEVNDKDYSLVEILQIAEANDTKVMSCLVSSVPGSGVLKVTLKVSSLDIGPLLQAFFRLNLQVVASWSKQDSYTDELQERYDALMNYLSI